MINVALVDLYLEHRRIRAEIPMKGFSRVSDLLNNAQPAFLSGFVRLSTAGPTRGSADPLATTSELVVRRSDIQMVRPLEEPQSGPSAPSEQRPRLRVNVVCEIGDWQLAGVLHVMDRIAWVDFLSAMKDRFVSFTNATIRSGDDSAGTDLDFILVNAGRISALYEAPEG